MFAKNYNSQPKKAISLAGDFVGQTTSMLRSAGKDVYKNSKPYAKQLRLAYPGFVKNAKSYAHEAGDHIVHLSHDAAPYLRGAEKKALRLGFVYLVYKLFMADDKRVYEATSKAKTCIRNHPVQSSLIALGAGLLVGKLWR